MRKQGLRIDGIRRIGKFDENETFKPSECVIRKRGVFSRPLYMQIKTSILRCFGQPVPASPQTFPRKAMTFGSNHDEYSGKSNLNLQTCSLPRYEKMA